MYACYVDLKKAYDSVWREGLCHKLKALGVDEKMTNIISNMYKQTYTSVIFKKKILPKIRVTKGLKQGDNLSPLLFNIYINDLPQYLASGNTYPVDLMGKKLNCLLWADDLILMSETPEGLQRCVHNLQEYCLKWKLEINMKKTKVMTFNKSGKNLKSVRILVNNTLLKNVTQYTYLGFTISASGTLTHGINNLVDKAKRAWFSIRRILTKSRQKNVKTYITLFDYVVKPIMLYASEIWGANIKPWDTLKTFGENTWERFHLQVCRNILGVHNKTSKIATLAEIGRYPIEQDVHIRMVRYLLRFDTMQKNKLAYMASQEQKITRNEKDWLNVSKSFLDRIGLSNIHKDMPVKDRKIGETNRLSKSIRDREREKFEQIVFNEIQSKLEKNEGKLVFYGQLKNKYGYEEYLDLPNANNRVNVTRIRLSAHKLEIETERYNEVDKDDRICQYCRSGKVGSEYHFIFRCPNNREERGAFFAELGEQNAVSETEEMQLLQKMFTKNDKSSTDTLGIFLS